MIRTTELPRQKIVDDYISGKSIEKIAKESRCAKRTVHYVLRENNVERRPNSVGSDHPQWKGGRHSAGEGYMKICVFPTDPIGWAMSGPARGSGKDIREHRLVMAHHLGRPLLSQETVHHINGIRDDNRLENLQLRRKAHGEGQLFACIDCGSHNIEAIELPPEVIPPLEALVPEKRSAAPGR